MQTSVLSQMANIKKHLRYRKCFSTRIHLVISVLVYYHGFKNITIGFSKFIIFLHLICIKFMMIDFGFRKIS